MSGDENIRDNISNLKNHREGEISENLVSYPFPAWGAPNLRFLNIIKNLRGHGRGERGGIEIILVQEIIFDDPVNQVIRSVSNIIFLELFFQGACNHLSFIRVRVCDPALAIKGVHWGLLLSQFLRHFPEGSVVGVESSKFVLPDLVLKGFDLPVYPVLNVVQHSLVARISRELPGFPGSVPLDHELSDFIRNVVGIPTPNRLGRESVCVDDRVFDCV
ncbi:hypothetical protein TNCV_4240411 [Trichonephila clavipes]|nr:hypothetical protein TNCV_4240411 [Trichonephila clavipes]